jgi:hypothetical protein
MASPPTPQRIARAVRRFVTDPRTVGIAQAGPRTVAFMARSRAGLHGPSEQAEGRFPPTAGLAAQVLLDEVLISAMRNPRLFPRGDDYRRAGEDIRAALELWRRRGWLDDPAGYHAEPPAPASYDLRRERSLGQRYERLTFGSGYHPDPQEPGAGRWREHVANRTAHAFVRRHRGQSGPWLVCVHGFGMGRAGLDLRAFRAPLLFRDLGLNLLLPVLPLHGPRLDPGAQPGEGFMSIDLMDSVHGLAQSVWDIRASIRWIRAMHGDVPVGVYGVSLGGCVAALVASVEDGLACAIAGIPAADLPGLYRRHAPAAVRCRAEEAGALGPEADAVHSVVSPLVLQPKVPRSRRYLFAGAGDRMSTSGQARSLWEHWERPKMAWYPGGHVGFWWARNVTAFVTAALAESGLARPVAPSAQHGM